MGPLNPYESPREPGGQAARRTPLLSHRVFPKNGVERLIIFLPLSVGLGLSALDSLRGLTRDMYSYAELSGRIVTYFKPPHWDEAAWASAFLLCIGFLVAHIVLCGSGISGGPPRTPTERWLATMAIVVGSFPFLLNCLLAERPLYHIYLGRILAFAIGLYLFSALFQLWYWWNRRQASLAVFWALHSYLAFCLCFAGQRRYRRPRRSSVSPS